MLIGGLQKFSLLDYPGCLSAIIFTQGCNFRCQFCYNPMLVWPHRSAFAKARADEVGKSKYVQLKTAGRQKDHPRIMEDDLFVFLRSRAGKLDAVVITGGEPCLQKDLPEFIKKIKNLGFLVKLDTNGSYPEMLQRLTSPQPSPYKGEGAFIDYIAMDLKAPAEKYQEVAGVEADFNKIHPVKSRLAGALPEAELFNRVKKSVKIIMTSGLPYEFRTTVVPGLLNKDDISELGKIIKGADKWYLQNFKSDVDLVSQELKGRVPYNARQMKEMAEAGGKFVKKCEVR